MANVTTSGNTNIKPRINTAKFMGSSYAAGSFLENEIKNINLRLSSLAVDIRKNLASITSITEILNSHSHDDGGDNSTINENDSKLDEISDILMDIGNAMSLDFANRIAENKEDISDIKKQKSKAKFGRAEGRIEKQKEKLPLGNIFTKTASKAASPISGIFGKLLSLGGILGTGILSNAVFNWFKDEENQKKVSKFFKILVKNWKWVVGTIGVLAGATLIAPLLGIVSSLKFLLLAATPLLLFAAGSDVGIKMMENVAKKVFKREIRLKQGTDASDTFDPHILKIDTEYGNLTADQTLTAMGGENRANIEALIAQLVEDRKKYKRWYNPKNMFGSPGRKTDVVIGYLQDLLKKYPVKNVENENIINNGDKNKNKLITEYNRNGNINIIPFHMDTIDNREKLLLSQSSVATEVLHISSKNVSDPYRKLSPDYYGIYV